jgi:hypothetical protein
MLLKDKMRALRHAQTRVEFDCRTLRADPGTIKTFSKRRRAEQRDGPFGPLPF